jgi:hypothetical protein
VAALLSGRYRLSRREVRQALQDLWSVRLSLGDGLKRLKLRRVRELVAAGCATARAQRWRPEELLRVLGVGNSRGAAVSHVDSVGSRLYKG